MPDLIANGWNLLGIRITSGTPLRFFGVVDTAPQVALGCTEQLLAIRVMLGAIVQILISLIGLLFALAVLLFLARNRGGRYDFSYIFLPLLFLRRRKKKEKKRKPSHK
ncbi:hypothetical protein EXS70_01895 [Candidatus Peribacteria bacterium]|nr:hypothetical protein [Candidatus Peribacteria bacterium]